MENLFVARDRIENRISYYLLCLFLIALPFNRFYSELVLLCFIAHTLIHINREKIKAAFSRDTLIVSSAWLIGLVGILYSPFKAKGFDDLIRQAAIVIFPLVLPASGFPLSRYRHRLLTVFALACCATILFLFADSLWLLMKYKASLSNLFTIPFINHNFSAPIGMHATYLSMYTAVSLVFFMTCFFHSTKNIHRFWYAVGMLIFIAGLLQLASRSVLIATIFILIAVFPLFLPKGILRLRFIIAALMVSMFALAGILSIDSFKKRYVLSLKDDLTQVSMNNEMLEPRVDRWHLIINLIWQRPVIGYGSGSEKELLKKTWFDNHYYNSYLHELNAHNQYLSFWLKNGAWGLLLFLLTLAYGLAQSWKHRDVLFATFITLTCIVSFSENILDVNKGIFFYGFFFSFFLLTKKEIT